MRPPLRKILLVEDDSDIALLARISLEEIGGWEVAIFESGAEAIGKAAGVAPDLIILDFRLPGINGDEVLKGLRRIAEIATTPIIFMTASVMPRQVERLKALGALAVLPKPFDPVRLPAQLEQIWENIA